ncbi:MFS general substrate transporter [Thozetella sp. PMI_491]|nr:MFS general substrate transporter [Thozetella sp. PMI_491]
MATKTATPPRRGWRNFFQRNSADESSDTEMSGIPPPPAWSMGVLNDKYTIEVPGSVLLLASDHNEPLGLRNTPARTSHSSLPTGIFQAPPPRAAEAPKKTTADGKIILEPQPEESGNDPLNWPAWRRDSALLSLGLFCMVGGGMTPILAAGFTNVASDYGVNVSTVSLTTGLYMMGMGLGSVVFSPTAILWGKRPVYLLGAVLFIATSVWCALSPNFISLLLARIFQGVAVSPVECLPSATIAEIFFLHERAFRIGIYTLLLLGGKNLVPLVSAAVMQRLGWRWVFWVVSFIVALCGVLLFFFVPETFWDRAPVPKRRSGRPGFFRRFSSRHSVPTVPVPPEPQVAASGPAAEARASVDASVPAGHPRRNVHVGFAPGPAGPEHPATEEADVQGTDPTDSAALPQPRLPQSEAALDASAYPPRQEGDMEQGASPGAPHQSSLSRRSSLARSHKNGGSEDWMMIPPSSSMGSNRDSTPALSPPRARLGTSRRSASPYSPHKVIRPNGNIDSEKQSLSSFSSGFGRITYTTTLREQPPQSFVQQLKPFNGRLNKDKWHKVAIRPLILFGYPAVLWSAIVYSCSVGWLIVISESVAVIYRNAESYNFTALQTGMVYISPFIGGVLGTAMAGKISDIVVKAMARRNGGLYEPEFRLVMTIPILLTTVAGLIGFGWSAQIHDNFMVPTVFFGLVSFGCSLGSTTSITFCVDSYRQYAGEALVTLNFSKNIFHGLVFSLFVTGWIESDGSKEVYMWIGIIQLLLLLLTTPFMFVYGKRARMWTVRKNFMEKF